MDRYLCIHGHFYQPPRENPWLEAIELQDSAYPYHDWNERITAECYAPNALSRILDAQDRIIKIVNNYAKISFDFGPTLLSWLQTKAPEVYRAVLDADRESQAAYGGHGSAMAQAYNHPILPLASARDKRTQIRWGVRDFEKRFGRAPEGMWLPETAVDIETLELLAAEGILFTVLAPRQASKSRPIGGAAWGDVSGGRVDPSMPYRVALPSGRSVAVFFYDGPISQGVAFEGLLHKGEHLAHRLLGAFSAARTWPQLAHIATDGETYGHHHRRGEMALAYALQYIESNGLARLTNYGEFLEKFPPTHEAQIFENSSWSCVHGIERWRSDCGCCTGSRPAWNQAWRGPLRAALDWLRDELAARFEARTATLLSDPWAARDAYIDVVLDRSDQNVDAFLARNAARPLGADEQTRALKLLEMQRQSMLMYTSCGWFFDELSGIEAVQVLQYAGRGIQLCQDLFSEDLEPMFLQRLSEAKSNLGEYRDGRGVFERSVRPAVVDLPKVVAHHAMTSLFDDQRDDAHVYAYRMDRRDHRVFEQGAARVAVGWAHVRSMVTREESDLAYGVIHFGDHNLHGGVRPFVGDDDYEGLLGMLAEPLAASDVPAVLRLLDRHFGTLPFSLRTLFRDEQRRILNLLLEPTLAQAEAVYRQLYDRHAPLMRFVAGLNMPLPRAFQATAEFALNSQLKWSLDWDEFDAARIRTLLNEARLGKVPLDQATLEFTLRRSIETISTRLDSSPRDLAVLQKLLAAVEVARALPFSVNLWDVQNHYYRHLHAVLPAQRERAAQDDEARSWVDTFLQLGEGLGVLVS